MQNPFRYWGKRYLFARRIQTICKKKGYRIVFHRDLMKLPDGNDDKRDFSIYTNDAVLSVKLIPSNQRNAQLHCTFTGVYSIANGTTLPQSTYEHNQIIQFRQPTAKLRIPKAKIEVPERDGKTVRNIFLVHLTCYRYVCTHSNGSSQEMVSGDSFLGWELWCGRDFRKMLKSL